jgi:MFS family permease
VLISVLGATTTLVIDAVSFLCSALGIRRIGRPEPAPLARSGEARLRRDIAAGWAYILARPGLRALFWNAMLFGGSVMLCAPLVAVLMLRDLGLTPWQYGLALGLPCLGGVVGARLMPRWTARFGVRKILLVFGVLRTPWFLVLPLAPPGSVGLVVIVVVETGLLFAAGVFNPAFVTYRMSATEDGYLARVVGAWSISSKTVQPLFMVVGGVVATFTGISAAIAMGGVLCLASVLLLPWRAAILIPAEQ